MKNIMHFEENSRLVQSHSLPIGAREAACAGAACARNAGKGARLLISHSTEAGAEALALAFASGAALMGAECIFTEVCPETAAGCAVRELGCDMGCYVHTEITASLKLFSFDGLDLFKSTEDSIAAALQAGSALPYSHCGRIERFIGANGLYTAALRKMIKGELCGIYADVRTPSAAVGDCCKRLLCGINDKNGGRIAFHISGDGRRVSAYSDETGYVSGEKLLLICCMNMFEEGTDIAVCGRPQKAMEGLAKKYGRRIYTCSGRVCLSCEQPSKECLFARRLAAEQLFTRDGIALTAILLEILRSRRTTLSELLGLLPPFAAVNRFIPINKPSELLKRMCTSQNGECDGVIADSDGARVVITPVRTQKGVILSVESTSVEAACELCDFYSSVIREEPFVPKM